jgi:hypothetical protein
MKRWVAPLGVLATIALARPATAGTPGPVCRQASVVDEITREVRAQDYYSRVDPALVTETPTALPDLVRCQVCVLLAPYDMTRFGEHPVERCVEHGFEVRILRNGFVVRDLK